MSSIEVYWGVPSLPCFYTCMFHHLTFFFTLHPIFPPTTWSLAPVLPHQTRRLPPLPTNRQQWRTVLLPNQALSQLHSPHHGPCAGRLGSVQGSSLAAKEAGTGLLWGRLDGWEHQRQCLAHSWEEHVHSVLSSAVSVALFVEIRVFYTLLLHIAVKTQVPLHCLLDFWGILPNPADLCACLCNPGAVGVDVKPIKNCPSSLLTSSIMPCMLSKVTITCMH